MGEHPVVESPINGVNEGRRLHHPLKPACH